MYCFQSQNVTSLSNTIKKDILLRTKYIHILKEKS